MRFVLGIGLLITALAVACSSAEPVEDDGKSASNGNGTGTGTGTATGGGGSPPMPDQRDICEEQCAPSFPNGQVDYFALRNCTLCNACFDSCTALSETACPMGGMETGCSVVGDCNTCINDPCTLDEQPGPTYTGQCAPQATQCSTNFECLTMIDCVNGCLGA